MSMLSLARFVAPFALALALAACTKDASPAPPASADAHGAPPPAGAVVAAATGAEACEHGVKKDICARCNPALKPAFVAKNDWCAEHERPESQCAICHPDVAKAGVKP